MAEPMKVAYVFPGQGAQSVGMGSDLYSGFESARLVYEQADEILHYSLSKLCFESAEEELLQAPNIQPAIVATSLAILAAASEVLENGKFPTPSFIAGHSLGEYTALAVATILSPAATIRLASEREILMHNAEQTKPGGMMTITGLDEVSLSEICFQTNTCIARFNCPGQLVISGALCNLDKAKEMAKTKGAYRITRLQGSGAYHTSLMQPAAKGMAAFLKNITFNEPVTPIIANTTAQQINTAKAAKEELVRQLCHGIQWQRSIEFMINNGVNTFIEIGPGKSLSSLIKKINKKVKTYNIYDTESIRKLEFAR